VNPPLLAPNILVIDTETGGFDPSTHSILSLGAVWLNGENLGATFETLVSEPTFVADSDALKVNKLTQSKVETDGVSPSNAVAMLGQFINESARDGSEIVLAGHNTWFDVGFLKRLYRLANVTFPRAFSHRYIDTSAIIQFLRFAGVLQLSTGSSDEIFQFFGVEIGEDLRHTALGDAVATAQLLVRLREFIQVESR